MPAFQQLDAAVVRRSARCATTRPDALPRCPTTPRDRDPPPSCRWPAILPRFPDLPTGTALVGDEATARRPSDVNAATGGASIPCPTSRTRRLTPLPAGMDADRRPAPPYTASVRDGSMAVRRCANGMQRVQPFDHGTTRRRSSTPSPARIGRDRIDLARSTTLWWHVQASPLSLNGVKRVPPLLVLRARPDARMYLWIRRRRRAPTRLRRAAVPGPARAAGSARRS